MLKTNVNWVLPVSAERVWKFVTDVRRWPMWLSDVTAVRGLTMPKTQAGLRFEVLRSGRSAAETWIVAEWEAGRHVRFTEYHQNIQLLFAIIPANGQSELRVQVVYPRSRGVLGNVLARSTPGGRWAKAVVGSVDQLNDIFDRNRDSLPLHNIRDE